MENDKACYKKCNAYLAQTYIKVGLPSSQNEAILTSNSGCFSYDNFHLQVKLPMKIELGDILFFKITRQGGGIKIFLGG